MKELRKHLLNLLSGEGAHTNFESAIDGLPLRAYGKNVKQIPYTIWQLVEHIRLAQRDILEYITSPDYQKKTWPDDYWPKEKAPSTAKTLASSLEQYREDLEEAKKMVSNPRKDLLKPMNPQGHTILREILLIADHTSYHTGQIILMRRLLNEWEE